MTINKFMSYILSFHPLYHQLLLPDLFRRHLLPISLHPTTSSLLTSSVTIFSQKLYGTFGMSGWENRTTIPTFSPYPYIPPPQSLPPHSPPPHSPPTQSPPSHSLYTPSPPTLSPPPPTYSVIGSWIQSRPLRHFYVLARYAMYMRVINGLLIYICHIFLKIYGWRRPY
jgi:hypothetical protein